jgi:hypothetical protein
MEWKHVGIFLASFAFGCVLLYLSPVEHKTVVVFPTPFTADHLQYKDKGGTCYRFKPKTVSCSGAAKPIPSGV